MVDGVHRWKSFAHNLDLLFLRHIAVKAEPTKSSGPIVNKAQKQYCKNDHNSYANNKNDLGPMEAEDG